MLLIWSVIVFLVALVMAVETIVGLRSMTALDKVKITRVDFPRLSVIITACNEAQTITETLERLSKQDYPALEIICVNDRSTDNTREIMEQFAQSHAHIRVISIDALPDGWIGKNYAAAQGAQAATGEWLLFMDADVHLQTVTLKKLMQHALDKKRDHISVTPHYIFKGFLFQSVGLFFSGHALVAPLKPWLAKSQKSKKSFNLGLFSLIKTSVYHAIGGHQAIANACVDDVALGRRVKKMGYAQEILNAQEDVVIAWYPTLRKMIRGLEKNCFAYFNYKVMLVAGTIAAIYFIFVFPLVACFMTSGLVFYFNLMAVLCAVIMYFEVAAFFKTPKIYAFCYPIGLLIHPFTLLNSTVQFIKNQGITWRGTFYSARMLKSRIE